MIEDKITLALKDLTKLQSELKALKKTIRDQEKIETDEYLELKRAYKDLKEQMKAIEEEWVQSLYQDEEYHKLIEMKVAHDEKVALANQELFKHIHQLPHRPLQLKTETEDGQLNIQIDPDLRLYVNGKEEKKRV